MSQTILIVDDEPNIVMTLEYAFKRKQFQVFIARDGNEAMDILRTQTPNVVLLDIMMPNVDGYETLAFIKKQAHLKNVKTIFLTAKNKESDIKKGLQMGVDSYWTKPFSVKKLIAEVESLLK